MHWLTALFLLAVIAGTAIELWLSSRQAAAVTRGRAEVPAAFAGSVTNASNGYLHGLHGGLVPFVAGLAVYICWREKTALGLRRATPAA